MYQSECILYLKSTENANLTKSFQIPDFGFGVFKYYSILILNLPQYSIQYSILVLYILYSILIITYITTLKYMLYMLNE